MIGIVSERLTQPDAGAGFVLDGFPRTVAQAQALDDVLDDRQPLVVVSIEVPEETLVERLTLRRICGNCGWMRRAGVAVCERCGGALVQRRDDNVDVVRERLQVYATADASRSSSSTACGRRSAWWTATRRRRTSRRISRPRSRRS